MKREKTKHKGIYKVGDTYYVTYYVGPKKYEKAVGPRLTMALKEKMERERKGKRGSYEVMERQEKTSFKELVDLYEKEGDGKKYILQFVSAYLNHFGEKKLSQIMRRDLFKFRDALKSTPKQRGGAEVTDSNVNRALAGLRRLFSFAVSRDYLEESPFPKTSKSGLFYPEKKGKRNYFKEKHIEAMLNEATKLEYPTWMKDIILTGYYTGMRTGESELLGLRWGWIDYDDGVIRLRKTKTLNDPDSRGQEIVMQQELIELLKNLPERSEYVFSRPDGSRLRHWDFYKPFKKIIQAIGLDPKEYSCKEIRHTTGTLMHKKGVPVDDIATQLRHTTSKTTKDFYIGADHDYQRRMAEKLILKSGKIVGKSEISDHTPLPSA
jgi:integrase